MNFTRSAVLGVVGSAFFAAGSMAADIPPMVIAPPPPPVVVPENPWAGPYVGGYVGCLCLYESGDGFWREAWIFGGQAGINFMLGDRFFIGPEIGVGLYDNEGDLALEAAATGRAGVLLGDNVALYAEAGIWTIGFSGYFLSLGGGVEVGFGESFSVFAEAALLRPLAGVAVIQGQIPFLLKAGVNFHLGN